MVKEDREGYKLLNSHKSLALCKHKNKSISFNIHKHTRRYLTQIKWDKLLHEVYSWIPLQDTAVNVFPILKGIYYIYIIL